jgi:CheY-like chemotaxis protein
MRAMPRILVADDNPLSLRFLIAALAVPGIECSEAADGHAAVDLALGFRHDLLLLDARMPGCSGADALARIRARDGPSRSAVAMATTADTDATTHAELLARGFAQVLAKPIGADALLDAVRRRLPAAVAEEPPAWIDEEQAMRVAGGDPAIASALRGLLAQELEALPGELHGYTRQADAQALRERLHRLDASAGICGVAPLREAIARVRGSLDGRQWPVTEIADLADAARRLRDVLPS